jgi:hypothetical protein
VQALAQVRSKAKLTIREHIIISGSIHQFHRGDRVRIMTGWLVGHAGVVEECQAARVHRVRMIDGSICYYSAVQLAVLEVMDDKELSHLRKTISQEKVSSN